MTTPKALFSDPDHIKKRFNVFTEQFTKKVIIEKLPPKPDDEDMSERSVEESKANMAASEAKVAATLEVMRRENSEARAEMKTAMASFQAENALFRETLRGFIGSTQVENAQFREQIREGVSGIRIDLANQSRDVEGKISALKVWVLAGTLTGLLALLGVIVGAFVRSYISSETSQREVPTAPAVEIAVAAPAAREPERAAKRVEQAPPPASSTTQAPVKNP